MKRETHDPSARPFREAIQRTAAGHIGAAVPPYEWPALWFGMLWKRKSIRKEKELLYMKDNLDSLVEQRTAELKEMQMLLESRVQEMTGRACQAHHGCWMAFFTTS